MEDKKEEVLKLIGEVKELRQKEDEIYKQACELLGLEERSPLEYYFFDTFFNDQDLNSFWEIHEKHSE